MILATIVGNNALVPMGFVKSLLSCREWEHLFYYGLYVDDNRNAVWQMMRERKEDLLFIDSDMTFTPSDIKKIGTHLENKDIVSGLYLTGAREPCAYKYNHGVLENYLASKLEEIDACGAGFLGISKRVISTLERPFTRFLNPNSGNLYGEDMAFCVKAKEAGYSIWLDPSIKLGHIKNQTLIPII